MKKTIIIVIIIVLIAALGYLIWCYDDNRIIEKPIDTVMNGQKVFSVKDNVDNVVLTIYDEEIPKTIITYYFKDDLVDYTTMEKVYENKKWARGGMDEDDDTFFDRKLNKNIVSGRINNGNGKFYQSFSESLIEAFSKSMIQIK